MDLRDRINAISVLPSRFNIMLEQALLATKDASQAEDLCDVACVISSAAWQHWLAWRRPEDNGQEHEWVVFANIMKIAEADEHLSLSEKRIATAFAFIHDSFPIERIMEHDIGVATEEQKKLLNEEKNRQRREHMDGGAENAKYLLTRLRNPDAPTKSLLFPEEIQRCCDIVREHDSWKVTPPCPPPTEDKLAVICLEGDVLWPLHPIGVLADLERPNKKGETKDFASSSVWKEQLKQSLKTLIKFRPEWEKAGIPRGDFVDNETIFRTKEGHRLYAEWRGLWNL